MVSERNRVPAGTGVRGGRFAVVAHQEPDLQLTGEPEPEPEPEGAALRCGMCGQFRTRASAHRCPAPGLVPLSAAAARVLEQCRAAGGRPLIVGGSVRDALVAAQRGSILVSKDVDIEVYDAEPAALARELAAVGRVDEVGVSFGVLKVVCGGEDFDVSLPRTDSKVGSGHRGFEVRVDHGLDEVAAFGRRDFTVNAMGWDPLTEELVDPYGGSADLEQGVLRHTTDAFDEDPLRVLRGMQLAGRFDLVFAPETAHRCQSLVGAFGELPRDRVWGEWCKVARKAEHPSASLRALHESGWEHHFVELADLRDVPQDPRWHPEGPVHVHTALSADAAARAATKAGLDEEEREVVVLAAMLHDLGKATHTHTEADGSITSRGHAAAGVDRARRLLTRMGAPHRMHYLVGPLIAEHMTCAGTTEPTPAAVRRLTRRLSGPKGTGPTLSQWAAVVAADNAGRGTGSRPSPADAWVSVAASLGEGVAPRAGVLTGDHLIAAGMSPGPRFRPLLAAALAAQDEGSFGDERGALAWLAAQD